MRRLYIAGVLEVFASFSLALSKSFNKVLLIDKTQTLRL